LPAKLPDAIKSIVLQQWLQGRPRNDIAAENGLSSGAVTNIVNEWRHNLGFAIPDELRELALTMRKVGIPHRSVRLDLELQRPCLELE
jgi:Helix-turn-helix domain